MGVLYGSQECLDPIRLWEQGRNLGWPDYWLARLPNGFTCPVGSNHGTGWVIMLGSRLNLLTLSTLYDLTFHVDNIAGSPEDSQEITLKNLAIVRAEDIIAGPDSPALASFVDDNPYLVELADRRLLYRGLPIDKAYNVRNDITASAYYASTRNPVGPADWTWQTMVTDIWTTLALPTVMTGSLPWGDPTLPFTPDGTPEGFIFYGSDAWLALEFVLRRLACALVLDPVTDTFTIARLGVDADDTAGALSAQTDNRSWDARIIESNRDHPATARVQFRKFPMPDVSESPWYVVDVANTETGASGGIVLDDDLYALYDSTPTLQNGAALATRAAERAADAFREFTQLARLNQVFAGPQGDSSADAGLLPGGMISATRWEDRGEGYKTEVVRFPDIFPRFENFKPNCCETTNRSSTVISLTATNLTVTNFMETVATATISSSQNNYSTSGWMHLEATVNAEYDLTGLNGGTEGRTIDITNVGAGDWNILNDSASSSAANRIYTPDTATLVLEPRTTVFLKWSSTVAASGRWVVLGVTCRDISCRVKNSGSQTITASAAATAVTFDQEDYDTDTMHDTGANTSRITFNRAGKYHWFFNANISMSSAPSAGSHWIAETYKNGSAVKGYASGPFFTKTLPGTGGTTYEGSILIVLEDVYAVTDYIEIFVTNNDSAVDATLSAHVFCARKVDKAG